MGRTYVRSYLRLLSHLNQGGQFFDHSTDDFGRQSKDKGFRLLLRRQ